MSEQTKMQLRFETFAADFLHPLLTGGAAVVDQPLAPGMLDHFGLARPSDATVDQEIYDRLHDDASEIAPLRALEWPDRGSMAVAMAAHDLVAVTDPKLDRAFARGSRVRILDWVDALLDAAGPPMTRGAALARHAIVSRALELSRDDVVVKNWAYTYRFFGRPVPPRVVALPTVRMVRQETTRVPLLELLRKLDTELGVMSRLGLLLSRSPVTQLLRTDLVPDLRLGTAALAVLSDDLVRNGIARQLVVQGPKVMAPLGGALRSLRAANAPPRFLFYVLALVYEAHVIAMLDARSGEKPVFAKPETADAALFAAVLPAMIGSPDDLGALLDLDPDDLMVLRRRAGELDVEAGPEASKTAVELVDYAEPPALDHERDPVSIRPEV